MKKFATQRLTVKELRKQIIEFAKSVGVTRVTFNKNGKYVDGTYNPNTKSIYLCAKNTKKGLLNVFFHELGHHEAVTKNKWKSYHFNLVPCMSYDSVFAIENKIDKIGKTLWNKYVDTKTWGNYKYVYLKSKKTIMINALKHINVL